MSQALQKLLNRSLHSRIVTLFTHQTPLQFPTPHIAPSSRTLLNPTLDPTHASPPKSDGKITHFNGFQIYPSFSIGYFLNPISPSGSCQSEPMEAQEALVEINEESKMVWADSVKKKRKKKMNKHKLKKLRKRLRHST